MLIDFVLYGQKCVYIDQTVIEFRNNECFLEIPRIMNCNAVRTKLVISRDRVHLKSNFLHINVNKTEIPS